MKKLPKQYHIIIALTALAFTVTLVLAAKHNLLPVTLWTQHFAPRTPISITATPLSTINKQIKIARTGSIESAAAVPINAGFSGTLSEIYVTVGQVVKAGQPLLKLQASSEPAVNQTSGASEQPQSNYTKALEEFNRYQKLFDIGAISRKQMEAASARLQEAKASLANAPDTAQSSSATVNGSATINAPINGIVTGISTAPGKTAGAGQQLLSLGSGQEVEVVVSLDQNDLYLAHLGTPATVEASQQIIAGQVSAIYPRVEANQITSFLAHIKLTNNPSGLLKSGMSVTVRIDTGKTATVPAVPAASVFQDNQGRHFVYVALDGKARLQQVSIGETLGGFTEITSELPQQSMIITSNITEIKDGYAVTVMPIQEN